MRRRVTLDGLPLFRSAGIFSVRLRPCVDEARHRPKQSRAGQQFGANTASEATAMTKFLLYMAPIVMIGLVATEAPATTAARSGSIVRNITATAQEGTGVPLPLVCQRGGRGGGGARAGGGGGSWAGAGRGNFSGASANRGNFSGANM